MNFKRHLELEKGQLDIAPLIDIVFQLLIFFLLTSSYVLQPGIKINLPKAVTSEEIQEQNLTIMVDAAGKIYFNGRPLSLVELKSSLEKAAKKKPLILLKADQKTSLGKIVQIWDLCRQLGLSQVNLATNQPAQ